MGLGLLEMQLICLELAAAFRIGILSQVPVPPPKPSITIVPPPIRLHLKPRKEADLAPGFAEAQATMIS